MKSHFDALVWRSLPTITVHHPRPEQGLPQQIGTGHPTPSLPVCQTGLLWKLTVLGLPPGPHSVLHLCRILDQEKPCPSIIHSCWHVGPLAKGRGAGFESAGSHYCQQNT